MALHHGKKFAGDKHSSLFISSIIEKRFNVSTLVFFRQKVIKMIFEKNEEKIVSATTFSIKTISTMTTGIMTLNITVKKCETEHNSKKYNTHRNNMLRVI
jgi:hypothetical protein